MITTVFSSETVGQLAIATGVTGLLGFIFIILFFSIGQPFGTLNDICIGLTAILSIGLVWMFYTGYHTQVPILSLVALIIASLGALMVITGAVISILSIKGWYLSGLYMAAGNAMIGLWVLAISYYFLRVNSFTNGIIILGLISGVVLALGLVAFPGIFRGTDTKEYLVTTVNVIWWIASIGYLALYPIWCILVGRALLLKIT